jgi:hypothetical protein
MVNMSFTGIMALQALDQSVCSVAGYVKAIIRVITDDVGGVYARWIKLDRVGNDHAVSIIAQLHIT